MRLLMRYSRFKARQNRAAHTCIEGCTEGCKVGWDDGSLLGCDVGCEDGCRDGCIVGWRDGWEWRKGVRGGICVRWGVMRGVRGD